jgi:ABC-2 type transport system ATP-binding protein
MDSVVATGISKVFRLHENRPDSMKERIVHLGRNKKRDFQALQPMDLTISGGQTLGILGHNGSGKSTLLKVISGILRPTTGQVQLRGRIASLLELGAGFHPELTGRENVYINAAFLGISRKEIERRFDAIVEFAELSTFIDEPVKHYSSGMYVRLGFAVAINLDPDILLVDEVLAVGDEVFQQKCLDRVRQFQQEGRTIVVVTHAADVVRQVCQRAIVLHHGELIADSTPSDAIRVFREHLHGNLVDVGVDDTGSPLRIPKVAVHGGPSGDSKVLRPGDALQLEVSFVATQTVEQPVLTVSIVSLSGQTVYEIDFDLIAQGVGPLSGEGTVRVPFTSVPLLDGRYSVTARISDRHDAGLSAMRMTRDGFSIDNPGVAHGVVALDVGGLSRT